MKFDQKTMRYVDDIVQEKHAKKEMPETRTAVTKKAKKSSI